ncbi:MAG: efflux transporter outer membrane subunit [Caulobacteraceae bacterium]
MPTFHLRSSAVLAQAVAVVSLAGCLVGPNYRRPAVPTPAAFKEARGWALAIPSDAADRRDWWVVFGDPVLNDLEARVEVSNQNLAAAEAAYRQARALVSEQRAALFPTVNLNGSANVSGGGGRTSTAGAGQSRGTVASYTVGAGASWAPDIWGAVRRAVQGARANAQASAADLANARLSAQMELAADYVALRQFDENKRLLDDTVAAYARSLQITQNKYRAGVSARSDVFSAQSQLDSTRAQDADLVQQRAKVEHAIAILTGAPPAQLTLATTAWTLKPPQIPAALPSTLLERRPDIAAAERLAAAANAQVGVQTAAYYPSLSLTGQAGFDSTNLAKLFSASNFVWSLGASAAETVFDAGLRHARVAAARAAYDQAVANYRQTVLTAFGQVEDNLAAQRVLAGEEGLRASASAAADANERITLNQYRAGLVDYTTVVVAEATALADRTALLQTQAARLTTAVDLIGALGGGWSATDAPPKP